MEDDRILTVVVDAIETAFLGHRESEVIDVWISDPSGQSYSIKFSAGTARAFADKLEELLLSLDRPSHRQ